MRLYVDLDNTLINPVMGGPKMDQVVNIVPRPDAEWFLRRLSAHGEPWLLTASNRPHARRALATLGRAAALLKGMISVEDLEPVESQIMVVLTARGLSDLDRDALWREIRPIAPGGVVFDDFPVGSPVFALKSMAVGIGPEAWIQVESFAEGSPDQGGLRKAYADFKARFSGRLGSRRAFAWA